MKFAELLSTIETLDLAYESIADEVAQGGGAGSTPSWQTMVRGVERREPGRATSAVSCAEHGGAAHGIDHDPLTDHLASEWSGWTRLARFSPTARSLLGIEKLDPAAGARIGATVFLDEDLDFQARFAATADTLVPSESGSRLWAPAPASDPGFRAKSALGEPFELFQDEDGARRKWSFSRVESGYEDYRRSLGQPVSKAALAELHTTPTPRLLGALTDYNRLSAHERVPLALSEAWLVDAGEMGAAGGLAAPCEACQFGLGAWMCGHDEMLARAGARARADYAERSKEWLLHLRTRSEPTRKRTSARVPAGGTDPAAIAAAASATAAAGAAAAVAAPAPPSNVPPTGSGTAAVTAAAPTAAHAPLLDLPDRDVTGWARDARSRGGAFARGESANPARAGGAAQPKRERVHIRLESSEFSCDDVEIRELTGSEAISSLFSFHVDVVCFDVNGLDTAQMLGARVSLVFEQGSLEMRRVHGMVAEVADRLETESEWRSYRLWIVPRVWRSSLVETQEVYLDISVPDLIAQKLALVGLSPGADVEMRLVGSYPVRELIVQYKETDVAFVSRLAEHVGISFFFEHDGGADKIVFSDANTGFRPLPEGAVLPFSPRGEQTDIFELESRSRAFPASFAVQDYNYRTPGVDLTGVFEAPQGFGGGVVEYGAHHKTPAEGVSLARIRAEEKLVQNQYYRGKSDLSQLAAGGTFELSEHSRLEGTRLLVVEVEHHALQTVKMQGAAGREDAYRSSFRAVDETLTYRPPRTTPRPRIQGVLTAIVEPNPSGEIGESANIDSDGRYTVKFYFDAGDLAGRPKNSRPVRMVQAHSGPNYGIHFPLKPGIEVLLVFMDGDPDRPLIVGSVPNPVTPSPVVQEVSLMNRIETASGLIIEMRDAAPPLAK